jgi:hypothetical protein
MAARLRSATHHRTGPGLTPTHDDPSGFLVCYDHYLRQPASGMAVYCLRGRANATRVQLG